MNFYRLYVYININSTVTAIQIIVVYNVNLLFPSLYTIYDNLLGFQSKVFEKFTILFTFLKAITFSSGKSHYTKKYKYISRLTAENIYLIEGICFSSSLICL